MAKIATEYDQPREKLQLKGVSALTNAELLQVIIGSGNAQASVARIAKRCLKVLSQYGNELSYDQLITVDGLGPARVCQIIASLELASRYPVRSQQLIIDSREKIISLVTNIQSSVSVTLIYITIDGAKRLISKRSMAVLENAHPSSLLRKIFADVVTDNAAGLIVVVGSKEYEVEPSLFDLSLARDLKAMAQLFLITVHDHILINELQTRSLKRQSW